MESILILMDSSLYNEYSYTLDLSVIIGCLFKRKHKVLKLWLNRLLQLQFPSLVLSLLDVSDTVFTRLINSSNHR